MKAIVISAQAGRPIRPNGCTKNFCRTFRMAAHKDQESEFEPKHMDKWAETDEPHPNCGIPNHAFYLAALQYGEYA